jgi:Zn-dependent protease
MTSPGPTSSNTSTTAVPFAPWVEWHEEACRNARTLITAVNQRRGRAIYLDSADLDPSSGPRYLATLAELRDGGFVGPDDDIAVTPVTTKPPGAGIVWRRADPFVRRCHDSALHRAFDRPWVAAQMALACAGAIAFAFVLRTDGLDLHAHPTQIPAIIIVGLIAVFIHEMGHALVTVHYGRHVRMAGLRLHLGSPAFYVESLDALLLTRRQRLLQAAAGPWAEWLATSVAALVFLGISHNNATAAILHRFVIVNAVVLASNLLPFVGLDGALLFADAINEPDLTFRANNPTLDGLERQRLLIVYSTLNAIAAAGLLLLAAFFWWQLFAGVILGLWSAGPFGIATLALAGVGLGHQLWNTASASLAPIVTHALRIRSKLVFRAQRRWRVRAVTALRALPDIAVLNESDLGILAGHLERVCVRGALEPVADSPFVIRRAPRAHRGATGAPPLTKGTVATWAEMTDPQLFAGADLVVLPPRWRSLLTPNVNADHKEPTDRHTIDTRDHRTNHLPSARLPQPDAKSRALTDLLCRDVTDRCDCEGR